MVAGAATHSFGWHSPLYDSSAEFLSDDEPSVEMLGKVSAHDRDPRWSRRS